MMEKKNKRTEKHLYLTEPPLVFLLFMSPLPCTVSRFLVGTGILTIFLIAFPKNTQIQGGYPERVLFKKKTVKSKYKPARGRKIKMA